MTTSIELDEIRQMIEECEGVVAMCNIDGRDRNCAYKNSRMAKWLKQLLGLKLTLKEGKECLPLSTEE